MSYVEVQAFRGTRQSSVYRCCNLPAGCVERMRHVAERSGLAALAAVLRSLEREQADVSKAAAWDLAHDVETLRLSGELLQDDDELAELAEVAKWCGRAPRRSWLTLRRRQSC